ncbi:DeoR/GlpR family DNA-binding transcription regulator [Chitinophaga sp. 212800010-3]|uniref:DeoR/GlpR family DNA-binding transcription regulator n=1 Tax=unclassified Chitinophaga TaxID=2619133 RepID=UPI002DF61F8D|nr:HTH deoR-type domain-containing protein [Chitinophaga sp. 212800010-3]
MGFPERKKKILQALEDAGDMEVQALSGQLGISAVTIRRDLQQLAEEGLLVRTHGGAMKMESGPAFPGFVEKAGAASAEKQYIGELAASLVKPGDTIFMDCGSTVFCMCAHLKQVPGLRIITNSLPVLAALMEVAGVEVNLVGGEVDRERKAMHGLKAIQHIESYHADKAFIGVDGLSVNKGLTAYSEKEASISRAMSSNANRVYLLCDASKIGKDSYLKFAPLSMFDHLITDKGISKQQKRALEKAGVSLINAI